MTETQIVEAEVVAPERRTFAISPQELKAELQEILEIQKEVLVEGTDYGTIPGTQNPTLLKPGAEKISYLYGYAPRIGQKDRVADLDRPHPYISYVVTVQMVRKGTGEVVGEGVGSCNNYERRYLNKTCEHWPSRQATGKKRWPKDHGPGCYERHTQQTIDTTIDNTVLKMAKKRALVDAVLSSTMASHIFTQDVEDSADAAGAAVPASGGGSEDVPSGSAPAPADSLPARKKAALVELGKQLGLDEKAVEERVFKAHDAKSWDDLKIAALNAAIGEFQTELEQKQAS